jgi:signal peptidase I
VNGRPPQRPLPGRGDDTAENGVVGPAPVDAEPPVPPQDPTDPGQRRRRRASGAPDERPAAGYRDQLAASGRKARPGRRRRPTFWRELPVLIGVALLLTFLIQTFLAKVYVIPSGSMETTLHGCNGCVNDRVLVDKISYRFGEPQPGDVVVFRGPDSWRNTEFTVPRTENPLLQGLQLLGSVIGLAPPDEKDFVKRVIAIGGQTVQCCDSRNRVVVDGEPLEEPYIYYDPRIGDPRQDPFGPVRVPEGQLWMMGDSRNNSADSRVPGHGPVPVENVIGKVQFIVLPIARFGGVEAIDPQTDAVGLGPAMDGQPAPLALGLLGALPLAVGRARRVDDVAGFLPGRRHR